MNFNKIKVICDEKGLTIPHLAEKIGFSEAGLYQSFRNQSMKVDLIEKISQVLETPIWVFFDLDPEASIAPLKMQLNEYIEKAASQETNISSLKEELEQVKKMNRFLEQMIQDKERLLELKEKVYDSQNKVIEQYEALLDTKVKSVTAKEETTMIGNLRRSLKKKK